MKKKIRVLVVENNKFEINYITQAFRSSQTDKFKCDYFFELTDSSHVNFSNDNNPTRQEQKKHILEALKHFDYEVVIFDVALRRDEIYQQITTNPMSILSFEISNEFKEEFRNKHICVIFTSGLPDLFYLDAFEDLQRNSNGVISNDWFFVHRPRSVFNVLNEWITCPELCENPNRFTSEHCDIETCFLYVLLNNYKIFLQRESNV